MSSFQNVNQALSYHPPHILPKSSYSSLYISVLTPTNFTFLHADTQSSHSHARDAQTTSICRPHHIRHTLYTQKTVQIHTAFSILQRHSAHPSHHHPLCPLQTTQIFFLHRPGFSPICQHTLDTSPVSKKIPDHLHIYWNQELLYLH